VNTNPFFRGYRNLRVERTLFITYDDDCPPVWRPLHSSQAHLPDSDVERFPCIFSNDFALITEGQDLDPSLESQCQSDGIVRTVVYGISGINAAGQPEHVGDTYSEESAREVVRRLSFEPGFYSQCWEISSSHLSEASILRLEGLADIDDPLSTLLFIAFRIPFCPAIGVKLIATPWTEANLQNVEGISVAQLRQAYQNEGLPDDFIQVLQLAAEADVRFLIFDADAPTLEGLPLY